jgi:FkbM family methyltransferase
MTEEAFWSKATSLLSPTEVKTLFDVGAHTGYITDKFLGLFPSATVYCFEPDPKTFQQLAIRFEGDSRVCAMNTALSSSSGSADFFHNADPHASSLFPRNKTGRRYYRKNLVMKEITRTFCVTLDQFAGERGITHIDLLKMDTQGAEFDILKGAAKLLSKQAIDVVVTEFFFIPHYENAPLLDSIWSLLRSFTYDIYTLDIGARGKNGQARWGDAIFVSRRHRERVLDASPEEE